MGATGQGMQSLILSSDELDEVVGLCQHIRLANWPESIDLQAFLVLRAMAPNPRLAAKLAKLRDAQVIALAERLEKLQQARASEPLGREH